MAYGDSWVETDPDGASVRVSGMDDAVRLTKRAIRERLEGDAALTGVFDSFSAGTIKAGSARVNVVAFADLGTLTLQDGRIAITSDTHRLYHLATAGLVELGYAPTAVPTFSGQVSIGDRITFSGNATSLPVGTLGKSPTYGVAIVGVSGTDYDLMLFNNSGHLLLGLVHGFDIVKVLGLLRLKAGTTTFASVNMPEGVAPTAPSDGDMWTQPAPDAGLFIRLEGSTFSVNITPV